MISFRPKLWTGVSAAVLIASAGALSACGQSGETGGETGAAAQSSAVPAGEGGEGGGEGGEGGAEGGAGGGEAGIQSAYANVPEASRAALHIAQLKGFFLIAQKQTEGADYAAALAGQGMLEAYDPFAAAFKAAGVDEAKLRKAATSGAAADLTAAIAELDRAGKAAGGDDAAVIKGMVAIASGLYGHVEKEGSIDSIEYQHSLGAALSAQTLAAASASAKARAAKPEIDKLVALWPVAQSPTKVTPNAQVLAQASRAELELS